METPKNIKKALDITKASLSTPLLSTRTINQNTLKADYAVRGPIVNRAYQISQQMSSNPKAKHKFPFHKVYMCNIGNPQDLGQIPITYMRQMLVSTLFPSLSSSFPSDVQKKSQKLQSPYGHVGAYTHSKGLLPIRENVSNFISSRDTVECDPENIFLSDGATPAIKTVLEMIIRGKSDGIMIPIPQYPLYSASINLYGGSAVGYFLDESKNWSLNVQELYKSYDLSVKRNITPRAIVIINPGNPTGAVLSQSNIEEIIDFAHSSRLVILADEVYQTNIYNRDRPFKSFRSVLRAMGSKYRSQELFSFNSVSKGMFGECGLRGGYVEMANVREEVRDVMLKLVSLCLCPNICGQVAVDVLVNGPRKNDPSYSLFAKEYQAVYSSLKKRAEIVARALNGIPRVRCSRIDGAMYAFPTIELPPSLVEMAREKKMAPDEWYCLRLLEETGVCVVPGSGFEQVDGSFHLRTTILPMEKDVGEVVSAMEEFHCKVWREGGA